MKRIYILAEYILRLFAATWKITTNKNIPQSPAVIAFWHSKMLPIWKLFSKKNSYAIVSMNKDGEILAHLLSKWNFKLVRGSSSNKGKEVIQEVINTNDDAYFLITPDGPRGPNKQCKAGAFVIAQRKQIPFYFIKCEINRKKIFSKSWDKFELPLLFSKVNIEFSDAIIIAAGTEKEEISTLMKYCDANF